jgi:hypothetical protein
VKKFIAFIFALVSGLYLLVWGPMVGPLDPVPIIDEATALLIFVKSMGVLGIDLSRFIPFLGKRESRPRRNRPAKSLMFDLSVIPPEKNAAHPRKDPSRP